MNVSTPDDLPHVLALIERAIDIPDPDEFERLMQELRQALREHIRRIRLMAVDRRSPTTAGVSPHEERRRRSKS